MPHQYAHWEHRVRRNFLRLQLGMEAVRLTHGAHSFLAHCDEDTWSEPPRPCNRLPQGCRSGIRNAALLVSVLSQASGLNPHCDRARPQRTARRSTRPGLRRRWGAEEPVGPPTGSGGAGLEAAARRVTTCRGALLQGAKVGSRSALRTQQFGVAKTPKHHPLCLAPQGREGESGRRSRRKRGAGGRGATVAEERSAREGGLQQGSARTSLGYCTPRENA